MAAFIVLAFAALIGPLVYLYGVDSRRIGDRGWMALRADKALSHLALAVRDEERSRHF